MADKSWADIWLLGSWTGFGLNFIGLVLTGYGVVVARGARKAAQDTAKKLREFDRSIEISRMLDSMAALKQSLKSSNWTHAALVADRLRGECVKLQGDLIFIKSIGFQGNLESLVIYFGSIEKHIEDGSFQMNVESFNRNSDLITLLSEKSKEVIRNAAQN
ncbi:hypothetical protein EHF33_20730 (plasmid) [Deinococcus psychrotolerans]|uniref:Uncharacterized protein n=1 Tax=Deinococcus psychrotolerans TaxID=2489213 RepID=A0A3G8YJ95_9DEIO|nr:hypothetical protein [Deinococcus psychrotolerans]AZI45338.1 hypothetical protein EHF33_20730 [Deinococcus psychrotolerans]